ncbi:PTS system mannose/fructose/sorbose family transporter subunit IID (plasmid) [Bacillus sp. F19]|nr:PTS system mannose/fructose/sorbose family transporter subunit IID [Bacillus sp. F19]
MVLPQIGGLAASVVHLSTTLKVPNGKETIELQKILDGFFPGFLSLLAVLFFWYLISRKKYSGKKVLLILVAITIVGVLLNVF